MPPSFTIHNSSSLGLKDEGGRVRVFTFLFHHQERRVKKLNTCRQNMNSCFLHKPNLINTEVRPRTLWSHNHYPPLYLICYKSTCAAPRLTPCHLAPSHRSTSCTPDSWRLYEACGLLWQLGVYEPLSLPLLPWEPDRPSLHTRHLRLCCHRYKNVPGTCHSHHSCIPPHSSLPCLEIPWVSKSWEGMSQNGSSAIPSILYSRSGPGSALNSRELKWNASVFFILPASPTRWFQQTRLISVQTQAGTLTRASISDSTAVRTR